MQMDCSIYVVKTNALISFAVTAKLICVFVFAYAKCWVSHDAAQIDKRTKYDLVFRVLFISFPFVLLNVPVNNFSALSRRSHCFLVITF